MKEWVKKELDRQHQHWLNQREEEQKEKKREFIRRYVLTFIASWAGQRHDEACASDGHDELKSPPIEDAEDLAELAWEQVKHQY
jgi:hypothetical protein